MTATQIMVGMMFGFAITVLAEVGPLPILLAPVGLVVALASIVIGGADGTLPRM